MSSNIQQHAGGLTWTEPGGMARTAHALASEEQVWLIDPFDDEAALEAAASLGRAAGVLQLLDRHNRDGETIAARLGVPLMRLPERVPDTPFEVIRVINRPGWKEIALWWGEPRALVVAEAIGTAPAFALGRRAGVHPLLRLVPPRSQLSSRRPEMLLVGHGETIESDAAAALDEALAHARSDIPRFVLALPRLVRNR
jgi:hypothetical protein